MLGAVGMMHVFKTILIGSRTVEMGTFCIILYRQLLSFKRPEKYQGIEKVNNERFDHILNVLCFVNSSF